MLLLGLAFLLAACGDEDEAPPPSPTAVATATATPFPPVDGTVPAQGTGGTDPVDIKTNPDRVSGAATLVDVRVGAHPEQGGWDRIVFEFKDVRPAGRGGDGRRGSRRGRGREGKAALQGVPAG